uniref:Uncharacterized protein n=1 Tax=Cacopsylla melanoneura TaxID=428564 RepID=A0A8D8ZBY5_9HEMI
MNYDLNSYIMHHDVSNENFKSTFRLFSYALPDLKLIHYQFIHYQLIHYQFITLEVMTSNNIWIDLRTVQDCCSFQGRCTYVKDVIRTIVRRKIIVESIHVRTIDSLNLK